MTSIPSLKQPIYQQQESNQRSKFVRREWFLTKSAVLSYLGCCLRLSCHSMDVGINQFSSSEWDLILFLCRFLSLSFSLIVLCSFLLMFLEDHHFFPSWRQWRRRSLCYSEAGRLPLIHLTTPKLRLYLPFLPLIWVLTHDDELQIQKRREKEVTSSLFFLTLSVSLSQ